MSEEREYWNAIDLEEEPTKPPRWIGEDRIVPLIFAIADRLSTETYAWEGAHGRCSQIMARLQEAQSLGWTVEDDDAYEDANEIFRDLASDLPEEDQDFEWVTEETLAVARTRSGEIIAKWAAELVKYVRH